MPKRSTISQKIKSIIFDRDKFRCKKCNFLGTSEDLEVHHIKMRIDEGEDRTDNLITLCSICHYFAPGDEKEFEKYVHEKIDGEILNTFRKSAKSISRRTKKGMNKKATSGNPITRAPFGYLMQEGKLIPAQNFREVEEIFQEFLDTNISLTQLANKHHFSVNGLKKILKNQAYLGKVKFDGQTHQGTHQPLISSTLFNHVQDKLEEKGRK